MLDLKNCMLEPMCNKNLRQTLRKEGGCRSGECVKCGWNTHVAARRMAQYEMEQEAKKNG